MGEGPETGKSVVVKDGRFGPCVTNGEPNATLCRDDSIDDVTLSRASELLSKRQAKGPSVKKDHAYGDEVDDTGSGSQEGGGRNPAAEKATN